MTSKITIQELDEALKLAISKAQGIDATLASFSEQLLAEVSKLNRLSDNSRNAAEPLSAYPDGITIMRINTAGRGFPSDYGIVITNKAAAYGFQFYSGNASVSYDIPSLYIRSWNSETGKWTAFDRPETELGSMDRVGERVLKSGDTMTGYLMLHADPQLEKHAATKGYVDALIEGLDVKLSVRAASVAPIGVTTATATRLTLSAALTTLDGVTVKVGDRLLVKDQAAKAQNGIYSVVSSTILDRTEDAINGKITPGMYTFIEEGTVNRSCGWVLTTNGVIVVGTTDLSFVQFSSAGQIVAGEGLKKLGEEISLNTTGVTPGTYTKITVNDKGQATAGGDITEADIPSLSASKIGSGVFPIARIPVGTTASTAAAGNHGHNITALTGVSITAPVAKEALIFDGTNWKNGKMSVNDLLGLALSESLASGHFLKYNGTNWANVLLEATDIPNLDTAKITSGKFAIDRIPTGTTSSTVSLGNHKHNLPDLSDTLITTPTDRQLLSFNGTKWVNDGSIPQQIEDLDYKIETLESDRPPMPFGKEGQIPFNTNGSNSVEMDYVVHEVMAIDTDADLASSKTIFTSNKDIFEKWQRFSHDSTETQPALPGEIDQWAYDELNDIIRCTINSTSHIGFYSQKKYDSYVHQATLKSSGSDDDNVGILIAFAKDLNGREHTLTALWNNAPTQSHTIINGVSYNWAIVYNFKRADQKIIADGTAALALKPNSLTWNTVPNGATVRIHRDGDLIEAKTTEMGGLEFNEAATLNVDLKSDPVLAIFRGAQSYGYTAHSQPGSTYEDVYFSDAANIIYDVRNDQVWVADSSGVYQIDAQKSVLDIGKGRLMANTGTGKLFYIKEDGSVVSVGPSKYRTTVTIPAGSTHEIDIHQVFSPTTNARNISTQVTVKDTDATSPTNGLFINSEAAATVARNDQYIRVINEYSSALEFDILMTR